MKLIQLGILAVVLTVGCKNNPYPDGQYTGQRPARQEVIKNYVIMAPAKVVFSENIEGSFGVTGTVPWPGKAIITFSGLPQGAEYRDDQAVHWQPKFGQGKDGNNPNSSYKAYDVTITLQSSLDDKTVSQQVVTLIVNEAVRIFRIVDLDSSRYMGEGNEYEEDFTILDEDYPQGPFKFALVDAPPGITITADPTKPNVFKYKFTPGYDLVDSVYTSKNGRSKDFNWNLTVIDPRNKIATMPVVWHISDDRQSPQYVGPTSLIVKSPDVNFVFMVQDPNLEVEPEAKADQVRNGNLQLTSLGRTRSRNEKPMQTYNVHWDGVPQTLGGTTQRLNFNLCVFSQSHKMDNCVDRKVSVKFDFPKPTPTPSPTAVPTPVPTPVPQFNGGLQ